SSFFIDIAMGIFTVFANNQIMKYLGTTELSIYAVIIQLFTFVQCCAYSVGQAAQPIMSVNFGAGKADRVKRCLKYGFISALLFGVFWTALSLGIPNAFVSIFMQPTDEIISKAPFAIRIYATSFILLSLNVASTYYFQSVLKRLDSFVVSILRGILVNGVLIFALPALFGGTAIWFVMPLTELLTFAYVLARIACAAQPANRQAML
ncbi:MAG: hypothetical protein K2J14_02860, partial [Treponemataceae bacterium]|nr:hypothetical protein [Treponemataceae bacterium]